jgi:hypothetical protein
MASVKFNPAFGIQSISGRLGNYIFYTRNGKQFVRERRAVSESSSSHSRAVSESEHVLKIEKSCRKH